MGVGVRLRLRQRAADELYKVRVFPLEVTLEGRGHGFVRLSVKKPFYEPPRVDSAVEHEQRPARQIR